MILTFGFWPSLAAEYRWQYEVAGTLNAPMDVFVVRKLGVPGHEELAMGAIGTGKARFINEDIVGPLGIPPNVIDQIAKREEQELERREKLYRGDRPANRHSRTDRHPC